MGTKIKGYYNSIGYVGWVERLGQYIQFSCYQDYKEYVEEDPK